jgi:hypothetical protein
MAVGVLPPLGERCGSHVVAPVGWERGTVTVRDDRQGIAPVGSGRGTVAIHADGSQSASVNWVTRKDWFRAVLA